MGNKQVGYKNMTDMNDPEYEQFTINIVSYLSNIRFGSKGFTVPLRIRNSSFDRLFLYEAPVSFDPFVSECWQKLALYMNDKCDMEYTSNFSYDSEDWNMTVKNIDKTWSDVDKIANYILIQSKSILHSNNSSLRVSYFLPDITSNYEWFDAKNSGQVQELFDSISRIGQRRAVAYNLRRLEIVMNDDKVDEVEGANPK